MHEEVAAMGLGLCSWNVSRLGCLLLAKLLQSGVVSND